MRLFGGHVGRRPQDLAVKRAGDVRGITHELQGLRQSVRVDIRPSDEFGKAPINHDGLAKFANHDVAWFEVPVYHAPTVRESDGLAKIQIIWKKRESLRQISSLTNRLPHRPAAHALHCIVDGAVLAVANFVDGHDTGVFQLASNAGLLNKAIKICLTVVSCGIIRFRLIRILIKEFLQDHLALQMLIEGEQNAPHPALGMNPDFSVAARLLFYPGNSVGSVDSPRTRRDAPVGSKKDRVRKKPLDFRDTAEFRERGGSIALVRSNGLRNKILDQIAIPPRHRAVGNKPLWKGTNRVRGPRGGRFNQLRRRNLAQLNSKNPE